MYITVADLLNMRTVTKTIGRLAIVIRLHSININVSAVNMNYG